MDVFEKSVLDNILTFKSKILNEDTTVNDNSSIIGQAIDNNILTDQELIRELIDTTFFDVMESNNDVSMNLFLSSLDNIGTFVNKSIYVKNAELFLVRKGTITDKKQYLNTALTENLDSNWNDKNVFDYYQHLVKFAIQINEPNLIEQTITKIQSL